MLPARAHLTHYDWAYWFFVQGCSHYMQNHSLKCEQNMWNHLFEAAFQGEL